jgi:MFS family permease
VLEGVVAEIVGACAGSSVLTGWALHLGAGPLEVGLLGAVPFATQLGHLPAGWVAAALGRRRTALWAVASSRQVLLLLAALPLLPVSDVGKHATLVAVAVISALLGIVGNNAWTSWMADLVPASLCGRYFGRRTAICTGFGTTAGLVVGMMLDEAHRTHTDNLTLAALAVVASICGAATTYLMARQHDPGGDTPSWPTLASMLAPWRDRVARRYLRYLVLWNAAVGVGGSFFAVHLLTDLRVGFTLLAVHATGAALVRIIVAPRFGALVDRLGAGRVLAGCSFGIALMPLVWLSLAPDCLWPLAVDALISGLFWSGHNLAGFAWPLRVAPRALRSMYVGAFAMAGGVSYSAAVLGGRSLANALPTRLELLGHGVGGIEVLFVLSALGRFAAALLALGLSEPRARAIATAAPEPERVPGRAA